MVGIITLTLLGLLVFFSPRLMARSPIAGVLGALTLPARVLGVAVVIYAFASSSFVFIDGTGHLRKVYGAKSLPQGQIIARNGEMGPQADILPPGFHFEPLINVIYDISDEDVIQVPDNKVGLLLARDGTPFRSEQAFGDPLHMFNTARGQQVDVGRMISDATYFLENGGQKGPQTSVLQPGTYRLNTFLFEVSLANVVDVPQGHVAVIKSNVYGAVDLGSVLKVAKPASCDPIPLSEGQTLQAPIVPVGCVGIWEKPLPPGRYYIHPVAYEVTLVDTRQQAWLYSGGYTREEISVTVNQNGDIVQRESQTEVPIPENAAGGAAHVKVEGWTVHQEARALVQVVPEKAPCVVATVGGLENVEDRVITPAFQSILRDIAGSSIRVPSATDANTMTRRPTRVLDFIESRGHIESMFEPILVEEAAKACVSMQEARLLETNYPPGLLIARKREQLAGQLARAYAEEQTAQTARISVEQERARANQQASLVQAEINRQRADENALAQIAIGRGERGRLEELAQGQRVQTAVLGEDRVMQLQMIRLGLDYFREHPEVLTAMLSNAHKFVPTTQVGSSNGGLDLTAALTAFAGVQTGSTSPRPQE